MSKTVEAEKEFIELCHAVKNSKTQKEFELNRCKAEGYSKAMQTILGVSVWAAIVVAADLSFDENEIVCAGIPMFFENKVTSLNFLSQ